MPADYNFDVITLPTPADKKMWGILAHVTKEVRQRIINAPAGTKKTYIKLIENRLKAASIKSRNSF